MPSSEGCPSWIPLRRQNLTLTISRDARNTRTSVQLFKQASHTNVSQGIFLPMMCSTIVHVVSSSISWHRRKMNFMPFFLWMTSDIYISSGSPGFFLVACSLSCLVITSKTHLHEFVEMLSNTELRLGWLQTSLKWLFCVSVFKGFAHQAGVVLFVDSYFKGRCIAGQGLPFRINSVFEKCWQCHSLRSTACQIGFADPYFCLQYGPQKACLARAQSFSYCLFAFLLWIMSWKPIVSL